MKVIGLIGGISWVSTADYYKLINEGVNRKMGGLNFSECMIYSFNYADIKKITKPTTGIQLLNCFLKGANF